MSKRCDICKSIWLVGHHHKFPQTKWARKLYGKLIDHPKNIQYACGNCHGSHKSNKLIHWTELEFCQALGITPKSKTWKGKIK